MNSLIIVLLLATVAEAKLRTGSVSVGHNPGAAFRLRRAAIDDIIRNVASLASHADKIPLPDVSATVSGVDIRAQNIRVSRFDAPQVTYKLVPPSGIYATLHVPRLGVEAPFNATRRTVFATQHDSGHAVFNASDAIVSFSVKLGLTPNDIPTISEFTCNQQLGPANLNVKNTKERFAIDVLSVAARGVRPAWGTLCPLVERVVRAQVQPFLERLTNVFNINKDVALKFKAEPVVTEDYVQLNLHGKCITDVVSPHNPAAFPALSRTRSWNPDNAPVCVFVSDAVFNDVLYQVQQNDKLKFIINRNSQPIIYDLVRLNCDQSQHACLGNVAPQLATKYGADAAVAVSFRSTKNPEVQFHQGKATFTGALNADLSIQKNGASESSHEATASVDLTGSLLLKIDLNGTVPRLVAKATVENVVVHIDSEYNEKYESKIRDALKQFVENYLNGDALYKGLPLKFPFGFGLTEPTVLFQDGTLAICSGFQFQNQQTGQRK